MASEKFSGEEYEPPKKRRGLGTVFVVLGVALVAASIFLPLPGADDVDDASETTKAGSAEVAVVDESAAPARASLFREVGVGAAVACAVHDEGSVWCWGGPYGESLTSVDGTGDSPWLDVVVGTAICGLKSAGELFCWTPGEDPVRVGVGFQTPSIFGDGVCALREQRAYCWTIGDEPAPVPGEFRVFSTGASGFCGVSTEGHLLCGDNADELQPMGDESDWTDVSVGGAQTCALRSQGQLRCWGDAPGFSESRYSQVTWQTVAAGATKSCGILSTGGVACWGRDADDQLPAMDFRDFQRVARGDHMACGIRARGQLLCWNDSGDDEPILIPIAFDAPLPSPGP